MYERLTLLMSQTRYNVVVLKNLQVDTLVNDVLSNLRAAAEANTLLGNDYVIDVNSVALRRCKSR